MSTNKQCVCNIGAQHCFVHNRQTRTQEEKIAFRLAWDARVDAAKHANQTKETVSFPTHAEAVTVGMEWANELNTREQE